MYILFSWFDKKRNLDTCIWTFSLGPFAAGTIILWTFHCQTFPCRIFRPWTFWGRTFQGRIFCRCTGWRAVSTVGCSSTGVQPKGSNGAPYRGLPGKVQSAWGRQSPVDKIEPLIVDAPQLEHPLRHCESGSWVGGQKGRELLLCSLVRVGLQDTPCFVF